MYMESQLCLELVAPPFIAPAPPPRQSTRDKAEEAIRRVLLDVLPSDATPSFLRVVKARFVGVGRDSRIIAELEMFDGLAAEVEAWKWRPDGWAHRWLRLDGGDLSWEDGRWWRITPEGERA